MKDKLKTRIGILGGGQLGKMLIESYSGMNLDYHVLEQNGDCPASYVCDHIIEGSLYDEEAIIALARVSDIVTYEIEHVNINALKSLEKIVLPKPSVLEIIQDKGLQKDFYRSRKVQTLDYVISSQSSLREDVYNWPQETFVLKHRKGGYDGRGVEILNKTAFTERFDKGDPAFVNQSGFVIEQYAERAKEFSVIVCIGRDMQIKTYDPSEMVFDSNANLMDYLISPSTLSEQEITEAKDIAIRAVKGFDSPGVFAVELIMTTNRSLYVNEIAPRPHNSGHHTIESCYTSQYEQLNRILLDFPLGSTDQLRPALTANILGPEEVTGTYKIDGLDRILAIPGVYIHLYGKRDTKPFRKLGHYTILGDDSSDCIQKMNMVKASLKIEKFN